MLEVGVVGAGRLGRFHALKYARMQGVRLALVVDADAARARAVAEEAGARHWSTDWREAKGLAAVSVATPTSLHAEIALALLQAGVDVLVEKPLAATVEEAKALCEAARRYARIAMVGHVERFNPALRALGGCPAPRYLESLRISPFPARSLDVSVVLDLMIHDLDLVLELVDAEVAEVQAIGAPVLTDKPDIANARIAFANGAVANISASRISTKSERILRVFAPGCYVSVDLQARRARRVRVQQGGLAEETFAAPADADPLAEEIAHFLDCVRTRKRPLVPFEAGLAALEVAARVHAAVEEGR